MSVVGKNVIAFYAGNTTKILLADQIGLVLDLKFVFQHLDLYDS